MADKYAEIAFTDPVKSLQETMGSRSAYARRESRPDTNNVLGPIEAAFIASRDSFYIASVSKSGWPYVQFRGGPAGFLHVITDTELGFLDLRGNRQYITTGNVATDDRVSLFLIDYPAKRRLKIFGHMRTYQLSDNPNLVARLTTKGHESTPERAFVIKLAAFDWNCPQHITPRYTEDEIASVFAGLGGTGSETCGPAFMTALRRDD